MKTTLKLLKPASVLLIILFAASTGLIAQKEFSIEDILSPPFPFELVSAKKTDRIAWIEFERGMRNVYTAAPPDFKPVRLTNYTEDNGYDLSNLRISDNGSVVVFVRGHNPNREGWVANPGSDPNGSERAIYAVHTSGGSPWRVAEAGSPILSPDGNWLLFLRDGQIYELPVKSSSSLSFAESGLKPLFKTHGSNSSFRWSPDSRKIAFVSSRNDHSFIGVYDREKREISYLSPGVDLDTGPSWSPDGKRIAFIRRPGSTFDQITSSKRQVNYSRRQRTERRGLNRANSPGFQRAAFADGHLLTFWVADVKSGEAHKFWHNPADTTFLPVNSFQWQDKNVVFRLERNNWRHYYSVEVDGNPDKLPVNLTPGEGEAEFTGFSSDGKYLFYSSNAGDIDRRNLFRTETKGGKPKQLTKGDGIETYPAPLSSGKKVAVLYADVNRTQSVALVSSNGGKAEIISRQLPSEFPVNEHVTPENVILTAEDGWEFHNQLFVPKDIKPGERRPAILFTHGGPRRQMLLGYHYMHFYHMAYAINQYFANQGYVVISVNYRSGIGYGSEFRNAPERGRRGSSEYQDVYAAGKYLSELPNVDPERIGLWGLSYGGILTAMGLARNSDLFAAGVDIAGIHLWGNSIETDAVSFKASSVATIDKWTSPVLLIHGDDDRNVSFSQTTGLVQLLRARNVHYELIVFPDEVHDFLVFNNWLITFNAADDFFDRFLREK